MKTVSDLITALQQYNPDDGVILFMDIKIYKLPVENDIKYIDTIPSNLGYNSIEEFYEEE